MSMPDFPLKNFFDPAVIKTGDIIGFSGEGRVGDIINIGTFGIPRWSICHVGIMGEATDGRQLLFESTTLDDLPCEIAGVKFDGTQAHQFDTVSKGIEEKFGIIPFTVRSTPSSDKGSPNS